MIALFENATLIDQIKKFKMPLSSN